LALAFSQGPQLLDVDSAPPSFPYDQPAGLRVFPLGNLGDRLLLWGEQWIYNPSTGLDRSREVLIATDGSSAGTGVVADWDLPGGAPALPSARGANLPDGSLLFAYRSEASGRELCRASLGPAGLSIAQVLDIAPGPGNSNPFGFTAWNGAVWFFADSSNGRGLYRSTGSGAALVDLPIANPGLPGGTELVAAGDRLFVRVDAQRLLSRSTASTSWSLLQPGPGQSFVQFNGFLGALPGRLLLAIDDPLLGREAWSTDGSPAGTQLLVDATPGALGSNPARVGALANRAVLRLSTPANGGEPWISDGTPAGTQLLKDILPGAGTSLPSPQFPAPASVPGGLYFSANDGGSGVELWFSDGTTAGTQALGDLAPGSASSDPQQLVWTGKDLYFTALSGNQRGLYRASNSTGIQLISTAAGIAPLGPIDALGNQVALGLGQGPQATITQLGAASGSPVGAQSLWAACPIPLSGPSGSRELRRAGLDVWFTATTSAEGAEPWLFDPVTQALAAPHKLAAGPAGSAPQFLGETTQGALFVGTNFFGAELHLASAAQSGVPLLDLTPGPGNSGYSSAAASLGGIALYSVTAPAAERGVWRSDGTSAGTLRILAAGPNDPLPSFLPGTYTRRGGGLWFAFLGDLHRFDGLNAPLVLDAQPPLPADAKLAQAGGRLVFEAGFDPPAGPPWRGLYSSDGSAAGTQLLADISQGLLPLDLSPLIEWQGQVVFAAAAPSLGREVWISDGTPAGTQLLVDATPGSAGQILDLVLAEPLAFFLSQDAAGRRRLWSSAGSPAETRLVSSGDPAVGGLVAERLFPIAAGRVALRGLSAALGAEPWIADGFQAKPLVDLVPGARSSWPVEALRVRASLLFCAEDPNFGQELFQLGLGAANAPALDSFGVDSGARLARLGGDLAPGSPLTLLLSEIGPQQPAALLGATQGALLPLGSGLQYLTPEAVLAGALSDGAGQALFNLTLPVNPLFSGRALLLQALAVDLGGPIFDLFALSQPLDLVLAP
jgi:ELWxxDGT repeat protein